MIYFIADTHFSEKNIMLYENRPFQNVAEMNEELVNRWNQVIHEEDEVYHLGDFGAEGQEPGMLRQLKGRKFLDLIPWAIVR